MVAEQTRQKARQIHLPLYSLPAWFDVDDRQTLIRLYRELVVLDPGAQHCPAIHTRNYLRTISARLDPLSFVGKGAAL